MKIIKSKKEKPIVDVLKLIQNKLPKEYQADGTIYEIELTGLEIYAFYHRMDQIYTPNYK